MKIGKFKIEKKMFLYFAIEMLFMGLYLAFDLLTKHFIFMPLDNKTMSSDDFIHINGVIRFVAVHNTGASFGIFKDANMALAIISVFTVILLAIFMFFTIKNRNLWLRSALILILAGGVGNLVDRFAFGYVRDFVYFELIDFAVFNFADSGLVIGTILLLIFVVFFYKPQTQPMYDKDGNLIEDEKPIKKPRKKNKNVFSQSTYEDNLPSNVDNNEVNPTTNDNIADGVAPNDNDTNEGQK